MAKSPAEDWPLSDEDRCVRNDGKGWRCRSRRFSGSRFCESHHAYYFNKNARASNVVKNKKKMENLGEIGASIVKKRSSFGLPTTKIETQRGLSTTKKKMKKSSSPIKRRNSVKTAEVASKGDNFESPEEGVVRVLKLGEIWAFSADSDGFSRSYARIDRIIPIHSSVLIRATPLIPQPISQNEILFAEKGISFACGIFAASESSFIKDISAFTHKAIFDTKGENNCMYEIFPKRGEVWAVYLRWDDSTTGFDYKFVEVISDFGEGDLINVFALMSFEGQEGPVYRREVNEGFHLLRSFTRGFMSMFSHQVQVSKINQGGEILWKPMLH